MSDILGAQIAIEAALTVPPVMSGGAAVPTHEFGEAPKDVAYPHITYNAADARPMRLQCLRGSDGTIQLDVWSLQDGKDERAGILAELRARLDEKELVQAGETYLFRVEQERLLPPADTETRHGVLIVNFLIVRKI